MSFFTFIELRFFHPIIDIAQSWNIEKRSNTNYVDISDVDPD